MPTTTLPDAVSHAELSLMLRAAVLEASPREHGREQARRATSRLVVRLCAVAAGVAAYDVMLLLGSAA